MITENKAINRWEKATNELVDIFVDYYFGKENEPEVWWVADDIGGVLFVNDYFFDLNRIREALMYKASKRKLFDFYDYELNWHMNKKNKGEPVCPNFRNYLKMKNV